MSMMMARPGARWTVLVAVVCGITAAASAQWTALRELIAEDAEESDRFGWSVGVSDGVMIVGVPQDDDVATDAGAAWLIDTSSGVLSLN